jgi:predicted Zn-dependent protease
MSRPCAAAVLRPWTFVAAIMFAVLVTAGGCATNPSRAVHDLVTMSEAQEIELGRKMHPQILQQYGRYDDEALQQYVNDVGQRIAKSSHRPKLQYTFTVLDSNDVNAFALPGGYVYITRGIKAYLNNEAQLAAVLGHEIGHVAARHAVRQQTGATAAGVGAAVVGILTGSPDLYNVANAAGGALISGYGRDMELEADKLGSVYLNRIGFQPEAMIDVVRLLKNQEMLEVQMARQENRKPRIYHGVFASHPDNDTRLHEVVKEAHKINVTEQRPDNRDVYLAHVDGLAVGSSRAQGVVRGSRFYHGDPRYHDGVSERLGCRQPARQGGRISAGEGRDDRRVGAASAAERRSEGVPREAAAGHADDERAAARRERARRVRGDRPQHRPALGQPGARP